MKQLTSVLVLSLGLAVSGVGTAVADDYEVDKTKIPPALTTDKKVDFAKEIKPIFEKSCINCHSGRRPKSKYSMETLEKALKGGSSNEKAIIAKKSDKSPLIYFIADATDDEDLWMPTVDKRDKYKKLTKKQISLVRTWIDQGAEWPKDIVLKKQETQ